MHPTYVAWCEKAQQSSPWPRPTERRAAHPNAPASSPGTRLTGLRAGELWPCRDSLFNRPTLQTAMRVARGAPPSAGLVGRRAGTMRWPCASGRPEWSRCATGLWPRTRRGLQTMKAERQHPPVAREASEQQTCSGKACRCDVGWRWWFDGTGDNRCCCPVLEEGVSRQVRVDLCDHSGCPAEAAATRPLLLG